MEKEFNWVYSSKWIRTYSKQQPWHQEQEAKGLLLNHNHEAERLNLKLHKSLNSQSLAPVAYYHQQNNISYTP